MRIGGGGGLRENIKDNAHTFLINSVQNKKPKGKKKQKNKYKRGAEQTRTSIKIQKIRCHGEVSSIC